MGEGFPSPIAAIGIVFMTPVRLRFVIGGGTTEGGREFLSRPSSSRSRELLSLHEYRHLKPGLSARNSG